jgi:hypothetical protein
MKLDLPEWAQWLLVLGGLYLVYEVYQQYQAAAIAAATPAAPPPQLALPAPASENWINPDAIVATSLGEVKRDAPAPAAAEKKAAEKKVLPFDKDFWAMRAQQGKWGVN